MGAPRASSSTGFPGGRLPRRVEPEGIIAARRVALRIAGMMRALLERPAAGTAACS